MSAVDLAERYHEWPCDCIHSPKGAPCDECARSGLLKDRATGRVAIIIAEPDFRKAIARALNAHEDRP